MRILIVGDSEADYLAKCHEAFRTGLRRVFDARPFGKGYPGFDPALRTYRDIIRSVFPEGGPDLVIAGYDSAPPEFKTPYPDLAEVDVPKAILLGDFWGVTEGNTAHFQRFVEQAGISAVLSYFPHPIGLFPADLARKVAYLPPCFDPAIFNDWQEPKRYDVGFLAAGTTEPTDFYPERYAIHRRLLEAKGISYLWAAHPGWQRHPQDHPMVGKGFSSKINSCRIFITTGGKYRNLHPKYFEILASRSALFADTPIGAEEWGLREGVNYVRIGPDDVLEKIAYYLERPGLLEGIAEAGYALALARHTCYARAAQFRERLLPLISTPTSEAMGHPMRNDSNGNSILSRAGGPSMAPAAAASPAPAHSSIAVAREPVPAAPERDASLEEILGVPAALLNDDNHPQAIALPSGMPELPLSSSPQYTLYRLIRHLRPKSILEIGSQIGASAVAMALAMRDNGDETDITCVDPFLPTGDNDGLPHLELWYRNALSSGQFSGIKLMMTVSQKCLPFLGRKFDFILIDGSHHYEDAKYDFTESMKLIAPGGHIWCHDYVIYHSVRRACDEVIAAHSLPHSVNHIQRNYRNELCGWVISRNVPAKGRRAPAAGPLKLHIGCGADHWDGYLNIDRDPAAKADLFADTREIHAHLPKGSVTETVMIHSLNYLTLWEARDFFRNLHALTAPGGRLIIETADDERLMEKMRGGLGKDLGEYLEGLRAFHGFGNDHLAERRAYSPNAFSWTSWHLGLELREAGFEDIRVLPPLTHASWRDMRIEARKPSAVPAAAGRVPAPADWIPSAPPGSKGKVLVIYDSAMGHTTLQTRGLMFKSEYLRRGWDARFFDYRHTAGEELIRQAAECDVTYTLKVPDLELHRAVKSRTRSRLVFDLTDALWSPVHQKAGWTDLDAILRTCDAIFSENERVCAYGRKFTEQVYSIPVCLQPDKFDAVKAALPPRDPGRLVVGYMGSTGTVHSLELVREALDSLARKYRDLTLRILGCGDPMRLPLFREVDYTILQEYDEEAMMREIHGMDVGLFPAPFGIEDFAIRGGQKAFLYMTAGVPPVAHNAGDCAVHIRDGVTGMLVDNPEDWYAKLDLLLGNPELRGRIGRQASEYIRPLHTMQKVFDVLETALLAVMGRKR